MQAALLRMIQPGYGSRPTAPDDEAHPAVAETARDVLGDAGGVLSDRAAQEAFGGLVRCRRRISSADLGTGR